MKKLLAIIVASVALLSYGQFAQASGYEELLGSTTLGSAASSITVSSIPAADDYTVVIFLTGLSGADKINTTFNNDTGGNYSGWEAAVGNSPATFSNSGNWRLYNISNGSDRFITFKVSNVQTSVKVFYGVETLASTTAASQSGGRWNDTSNLINRIDVLAQGGSVTFAAGSYIKVYGHNTSNPAAFPANADGYLRNNGSGTITWDNASTVKSFLSLNNVENTALSTWAGTTNLTTLGTITTGTWSGTTLAVNKGGTGQTSYTDGQVLIGNTSSGGLDKTTLTAGTNVTVTNGNGSISIASSGGGSSLPADAAGWLENDGAGTLSWSNPPGTGGSMETTCATGGDYTSAVWEPCQPFGGLDVVAMLGVLLCVVIFFAVGLWPQKR